MSRLNEAILCGENCRRRLLRTWRQDPASQSDHLAQEYQLSNTHFSLSASPAVFVVLDEGPFCIVVCSYWHQGLPFCLLAIMADAPVDMLLKGRSGSNIRGLLRIIILGTIAAAAVSSRLFSVIRMSL